MARPGFRQLQLLIFALLVLCMSSLTIPAQSQTLAKTPERTKQFNEALAAGKAGRYAEAEVKSKDLCLAGYGENACTIYAFAVESQVADGINSSGCYTPLPQANCVSFYRTMYAKVRPVCDPPVSAKVTSTDMCREFYPQMRSLATWSPEKDPVQSASKSRPVPATSPSRPAPQTAQPSGSTASASGTRSVIVAGNGRSAMDCVTLIEIPHAPAAAYTDGRIIENKCAGPVEVEWCYADGDCERGGGAQWTLKPGVRHPVSASRPIRWAACHGGNTISFEKGSAGNRFICMAPSK